ncbi:AMSH-like ubiquitin thioesterase 3 isoform X1 [Cryptomeria japonica]|uniref:AMSH-like ubiquitin thioesterase 3 isoform X1 n=1 Tax=Cryptomeria japonica TaxID=3369 RepID=UPI0027DA4532|nr:AMSH-like ubiquitin thioesterase 3 isoform X1 [Cryptomeria japonica]
MRGPMSKISIAANTQKIDVDNRMSLHFYYRLAGNMLKQANIYREEKNLIDLYIILLRFSSLISETIPQHRDFKQSHSREKVEYKKKLLDVVSELERLKPEVQRQLDELNKRYARAAREEESSGSSLEWPPRRNQGYPVYENGKAWQGYGSSIQNNTRQNSWRANEFSRDQRLYSNQFEQQFNKLAISIPRAREETLSRHSFLGPNGLHGQWQAPTGSARMQVQYPSQVDLTPIEMPCLDWTGQNSLPTDEAANVSTSESTLPETILSLDTGSRPVQVNGSSSLSAPGTMELFVPPDIVRQPSPPPVLAPVQNIPAELDALTHVSHLNVADPRPGPAQSLQDDLVKSKSPQYIQISIKMMDDFMRLAKYNTDKNLETCGVLAGTLKKRTFYVTTLIIPKQESTSDSCQTTNEEDIFDVQDKRSLFPLGWIHTHPSQSCFMSSIDLHTHYSYQIMLPEAVAIVMAPTDTTRKYGIFRLSDPGGVNVIKQCQQRGFHPHEEPPDGSPIYEHCSHVLIDPSLKFDVIDLR